MTPIQEALTSGDPAEMALALLDEMQARGGKRDREKACRLAAFALEFDWDGTSTGITEQTVSDALTAIGR